MVKTKKKNKFKINENEQYMKYILRFIYFWYHFVIGDDWRIAISVIVGFSITLYLTNNYKYLNIWWLIPLLVSYILTISFWLEIRKK